MSLLARLQHSPSLHLTPDGRPRVFRDFLAHESLNGVNPTLPNHLCGIARKGQVRRGERAVQSRPDLVPLLIVRHGLTPRSPDRDQRFSKTRMANGCGLRRAGRSRVWTRSRPSRDQGRPMRRQGRRAAQRPHL